MKILLTGRTGQVGYELERSLRTLGEVVAPDRSRMDLADLDQVRAVIRAERPGLIVNAAAYTAVDKAETEPGLAHRINAEAPAAMAAEARLLGAAMVHYSTDYVFDGSKQGAYVETDPTGPLNVYGHSKLAGEHAIAAAGIPHLILRTSWVYGMHGRNFLLTMLRLAQQRDTLHVVADQHGCPTWSRDLASATAALLQLARDDGPEWWMRNGGLYHMAAQGSTTWHGFAHAIMAEADVPIRVAPITTSEYPAPAVRPANSVLDCKKLASRFLALPAWEKSLPICLAERSTT
jgi:dTDP-4-dehydrorhamnose reductase